MTDQKAIDGKAKALLEALQELQAAEQRVAVTELQESGARSAAVAAKNAHIDALRKMHAAYVATLGPEGRRELEGDGIVKLGPERSV